jgi:hypothetical protein
MSIFISYRRDPSKVFADKLRTVLQRELQRSEMPTADTNLCPFGIAVIPLGCRRFRPLPVLPS